MLEWAHSRPRSRKEWQGSEWVQSKLQLPRNRQTNLWWTASAIKMDEDPPREPALVIEDAPETVTSIRARIPVTPDLCVVEIASAKISKQEPDCMWR